MTKECRNSSLMANHIHESEPTDPIKPDGLGSVAAPSVVDVVASDKLGLVVVEKFGLAAVDLKTDVVTSMKTRLSANKGHHESNWT